MTTAGDDTTDATGAATTSAGPTTTDATSGPLSATHPTTHPTTVTSTDATSSTTDPSGTTATTMLPGGPPSLCGPPCDETWTYVGDLEIGDFMYTSTDEFKCMTRVIGNVGVYDFDQQQLSGLRNLVSIEGNLAILSDTLTDLSPFSCLEEVTHQIQLGAAQNLTDVSGFSALRHAEIFMLWYTAATSMPTFAPDFAGIGQVDITGNPQLADLDAMAHWKAGVDGVWTIVRDNDALKSVAGLQPLLASSPTPPHVWLEDLPALQSLAGLEGLASLGFVDLYWLPLVEDLAPLAQLKTVQGLSLGLMPLVKDLQPLSQLETAGSLALGSCAQYDDKLGMAGLTSLAGLSSLTSLGSFMAVNNDNLVSLAGADKLTDITGTWAEAWNPALAPAAIDAFSAQIGQGPCWPDDRACICYQRPNEGTIETE